MAIKSVRKYEAADGKLFDDMNEAYKHDSAVKAKRSVAAAIVKAANLPNSQCTANVDTLAYDLFNKPENALAMRDALNRVMDYHRRWGKLKVTK